MPFSRILIFTGIVALLCIMFASVMVGGFWGDPVFSRALSRSNGDVVKALEEVGQNEYDEQGQLIAASLRKVEYRRRLPPIRLNNTALTYVKKIKTIRKLGVGGGTNVNDNGMQHIAEMTQLENLNLNGAKITDRGLKKLESLKNLKLISLYVTGVTQQGVDEFKAAVPDCKVLFGNPMLQEQ